MTVSDSVPKRTLKIKISSRKAELVLNTSSCEISQQLYTNNDCVRFIPVNRSNESMTERSNLNAPQSTDSLNLHGADRFKDRSMKSTRKRGSQELIDSEMNKRQKIDHSLKRQCGRILEAMIKHPDALGFLEPVDPVKLNIPDYFSVISNPMDLGTVRTKLQHDMYSSIEEFKADVRLTFSNAIMYNPPDNYYNKMAKKLDGMFNVKWKYLEAGLTGNGRNCKESCREKKIMENRHLSPRISPVHDKLYSTVSSEEKRKQIKELGEETRRKINEKREPARKLQYGICSGKVFRKGTVSGDRSTCGSVKTISSLSTVASGCRSCGSLKCQCNLLDDYPHASSKVLVSERSPGQDFGASKMEHDSRLISSTCKSDLESDGAVSVLDEENIYSSPQMSGLGISTTADGLTPAIDLQLSPKKALRAAILKRRFADTILKAKRKTLLDHDEKVDPVKLQQEKEKLERQQKEEKARIEAQIRAAELASSQKAQEDRRRQREKEREAARLALQKMEQTVEIDDNMKFLKELDMFRRSIPSNCLFNEADKSEFLCDASQDGRFKNILERLGLFIKDDQMDDEDAEDKLTVQDVEEGQI